MADQTQLECFFLRANRFCRDSPKQGCGFQTGRDTRRMESHVGYSAGSLNRASYFFGEANPNPEELLGELRLVIEFVPLLPTIWAICLVPTSRTCKGRSGNTLPPGTPYMTLVRTKATFRCHLQGGLGPVVASSPSSQSREISKHSDETFKSMELRTFACWNLQPRTGLARQ